MKRFVLLAVAASMSHASFAADTPAVSDPVAVLVPVRYAPDAVVPPDVKADCHIEAKVAGDLGEALASHGLGGATTTSAGRGQTLRVTIERVVAQGGGGWSGPKTISLSVQLLQDGQVLRSTHLSLASKSLNPFSKTCASTDRASEKLSPQIVKWLIAQQGRATLGATAASAVAIPASATVD